MVHPAHKRITFLVFAAAAAYFAFFSWLSLGHYEAMRTQMNDLGNADHAIWKASRGDWAMLSENYDEKGPASRFGLHANVLYWAIAPFYRLWPTPKLLLLITSLACALGGAGLYFFARARLKDARWALVPAFAYWASPMVQDANLFDFKVLTLAALFVIWMAWAFETGREKAGWAFFALAMSCQEDVPPALFLFGLGECLTRDRRRGFWMMGLSVAYLMLLYFFVVPYLNAGPYRGTPDNRYMWLKTAWPSEVIGMMLRPERLRLVIYLLLSGALVAWRGWRYLLLLVTPLLGGIISKYPGTSRVTGSYYWVLCEAGIVLACVAACSGQSRRPLVYLAAATAFFSVLFSPLPYGLHASWLDFRPAPECAAIRDIHRLIPPGASVSAQNNVAPHLTHRDFITTYPLKSGRAEYVVFHVRYTASFTGLASKGCGMLFGMQPWEIAMAVKEYVRSDRWGLIMHKDGFYVFRRGAADKFSPAHMEKIYDHDVRVLKWQFSKYSEFAYSMRFLNFLFTWEELGQYVKRGFGDPAKTASPRAA